jgi:hypothetical protein
VAWPAMAACRSDCVDAAQTMKMFDAQLAPTADWLSVSADQTTKFSLAGKSTPGS